MATKSQLLFSKLLELEARLDELETIEFARTRGSRDKTKRKRKGMSTAAKVGAGLAGAAVIGAGVRYGGAAIAGQKAVNRAGQSRLKAGLRGAKNRLSKDIMGVKDTASKAYYGAKAEIGRKRHQLGEAWKRNQQVLRAKRAGV